MLSVSDLKNAIALGEVPQTKASLASKGGGGGGGVASGGGGGGRGSGFNSVFNPPGGGGVGGSLRVTSAGRMVGESATMTSSAASNVGGVGGAKTGLAEALDPIMTDPEAALTALMKSRQALVRDHLAS